MSHNDIDYYCFTDSLSSVATPWIPVHVMRPDLSPKDQNRFIKMHPHVVLPDYEYTLYIDGSIRIEGNLHDFLSEALSVNGDVCMYEHPKRSCAYDEAEACAHLGYDWAWNIRSQMAHYHRSGFPSKAGLFEAGVIFRRNTIKSQQLMEAWWAEYMNGVKRDQLSLVYVSSKTGVQVTSLGTSDAAYGHRYFRFINHRVRYRIPVLMRILINRSLRFVGLMIERPAINTAKG